MGRLDDINLNDHCSGSFNSVVMNCVTVVDYHLYLLC